MTVPLRACLMLVAFLGLLAPAAAQDDEPWTPELSLATIAPGHHDANAWYGHSAIVATRPDGGADYYTYRLHWPDDTPRAIGSALGGATFRLHRIDSEEALADYAGQGREVRVLVLPMEDDAAQAMRAGLEAEVESSLASPYAYDPIEDNCATHIRDFVDAILGGALAERTQGQPAGTRREAYEPYVAHDLTLHLALELLVGPHADRPLDAWDAMFLPLELETHTRGTLAALGHDATPHVVLQATRPLDPPVSVFPVALAASLVLTAAALAAGWAVRSRRLPAAVAAVPALVACLLVAPVAFLVAVSWLGDLGAYFATNANILIASPFVIAALGLAVWALGSAHGRTWLRRALVVQAALAALAVLSLAAPSHQDNAGVVAVLAPLWIGLWGGTSLAADADPADEAA